MTTLALLRDLYRDETSGVEHLTASAPPVVRQVIERAKGYDLVEEQEPADRVGRSLSAAMVQLVGSITDELAFYPPRFPVRRALAEWDRSCRRRHRGQNWFDHAVTPICGQMLWNVVADGASVYWCSTEYGISYPRAGRLIQAGQRFVAERLARWEDEKLGLLHDRTLCSVCREEEAG